MDKKMITYDLLQALKWLTPAVYIIGLFISIGAFRNSRRKGYVVIAVYFAFALFALLAMPKINRAIAANRPPAISEPAHEEIYQEIDALYQEIFTLNEQVPPTVATRNINIPFGPILLVAGLWLVARREKNPSPSSHT